MKKSFLNYLFCVLVLWSFPVCALRNDSFFSGKEPKIFINNRILTRVNGKPISTYDVVKKLDLSFYRQYPQYANNADARIQFYNMNWKAAFSELIDKELILADAKDYKITVSSGDLRQEIEESFGPNIISNLDKAGLTYSEASKLMEDEIIIRKIITGKVHVKALKHVTPIKIRAAYEDFIQDPANARLTEWTYKIITLKERTFERSEAVADAAYTLLQNGTPLDQLTSKLKEQNVLGRKGSVTLSNSITQNDKEISEEFLKSLSSLEEGHFSKPFKQKSRSNQAVVFRILVLEKKSPGGIPTYVEMESILKEKLLDTEIDKESDIYLAKLREHHRVRDADIEALLPEGYEPFILK